VPKRSDLRPALKSITCINYMYTYLYICTYVHMPFWNIRSPFLPKYVYKESVPKRSDLRRALKSISSSITKLF
jgi:hypothetical protein